MPFDSQDLSRSRAIVRGVFVSQHQNTTKVRLSLPFPLLLAAHAGRSDPQLATCVLLQRLGCPQDVDLDALAEAMAGFHPMLTAAVAVITNQSDALAPDSMRLRVEDNPNSDCGSMNTSAPKMATLYVDVHYSIDVGQPLEVMWHNTPLPRYHHYITDVMDNRSGIPLPKTWVGEIDGSIRFGRNGALLARAH